MNRYLISVTTPNYAGKTGRFFTSLPLIRSCKPVTILLDFNDSTDGGGKVESTLRQTVDWVEFRHLPLPPSASFGMIQAGQFLDALPEADDTDLVLLTDMDIDVQRSLLPEEWEYLEHVTETGRLAATWNGGSGDNLKLEGQRIGLSEEWVKANCDVDIETVPCMNCGVMAGRVFMFRELRHYYERLCEGFFAAAPHRSRCQWLQNWIVHW